MIGASRSSPAYFGEREWRRLDVRDRDAADHLIGEICPDLVLNSASVVGDWEATAIGAVNVASATARRGVRQLLMSTDAVFASRDEGYREDEARRLPLLTALPRPRQRPQRWPSIRPPRSCAPR